VRGRGLMLGVEIVTDKASLEPDYALAERIYYRCLENGLSFKISAGNVLTLSPPLVIAKDDLDRALTTVEDAAMAG
jgi:4-aminobutyrate aminotransferase